MPPKFPKLGQYFGPAAYQPPTAMEDEASPAWTPAKTYQKGTYPIADIATALVSPAKPVSLGEVQDNPAYSLAYPDPMAHGTGSMAAVPSWIQKLANKPYSRSIFNTLRDLSHSKEKEMYKTLENWQLKSHDALTKARRKYPDIDLTHLPKDLPITKQVQLKLAEREIDPQSFFLNEKAPLSEFQIYDLHLPTEKIPNWLHVDQDAYKLPSVDFIGTLPPEYKGLGIGRQIYQILADKLGRVRSQSAALTTPEVQKNIWDQIGKQIIDPSFRLPLTRSEKISKSMPLFDATQEAVTKEASKYNQLIQDYHDLLQLTDKYRLKADQPSPVLLPQILKKLKP